jgi:hypothetical protein
MDVNVISHIQSSKLPSWSRIHLDIFNADDITKAM